MSASAGSDHRRPRVLVLVENLSVPFDTRVWKESRALAEAGYDVTVVCPRGDRRDTEPYAEIDGIAIHRFPFREAATPLGYIGEYGGALWHMLRLARSLDRRQPFDVVHICNPPDLLFLVALALKLRSSTAVVFDHHDLVPELFLSRFPHGGRPLYWASRVLERLTFATADVVLSTNESYRRVATGRGKVPADRVHVVRSAPETDRFVPRPPVTELKRGKKHLACYLGVMGHQDGVDQAVRALAHVRHELGRDDLHAAFLGSGDAYDDCRRLTTELGLDDRVEFLGRVPFGTVLDYLSTADVCLSPDPKTPLNDVSTMNKVAEYMAMARPVVSFDLVEAEVTAGAAAVYARDVAEFGERIAELLDEPERRSSMGELGRRRIVEHLSWSSSKERLLAAYDQVMALRGRA